MHYWTKGRTPHQWARYRWPEGVTYLKKAKKQRRATRVQYGALAYRLDRKGSIAILLVTSRATKRWIIPKGWPIKGLKPSKAAAREAYEEAGVRGRVARRALGRYRYDKRMDERDASIPCEVQVYPLAFKRQAKDWPESEEREARWFSAGEAVEVVKNDGLRDLILQLETSKGKFRGSKRDVQDP